MKELSRKKILKDIKKAILGHREFNYIKTDLEKMLYPIDYDFTLQDESFYYSPKDKDGIPQRSYDSIGITYNPTRIASFAIAHWNRYKESNNKENYDEFNKCLEWFMKHQVEGKWYYYFNWKDLKAPWISGMAQGQGISVLVRGYKETGKTKYLSMALEAVRPFEKTIVDGGVVSYLNGTDLFFEEYPNKSPTHVLNGYLFSVIGLIDLINVLNNNHEDYERVNELVKKSISTLDKHVQRWDNGYWSVYDLANERTVIQNTCTMNYHSLHITQLRFIAEFSQNSNLLNVSDKWNAYVKKKVNRIKALIIKILYRIRNRAQR